MIPALGVALFLTFSPAPAASLDGEVRRLWGAYERAVRRGDVSAALVPMRRAAGLLDSAAESDARDDNRLAGHRRRVHLAMSILRARLGQHTRADTESEIARRLYDRAASEQLPEGLVAFQSLGVVAIHGHRGEKALELLTVAATGALAWVGTQVGCALAPSALFMGLVARDRMDLDDAAEWLKTAVSLCRGHDEPAAVLVARRKLAEVAAMRGDPEGAVHAYEGLVLALEANGGHRRELRRARAALATALWAAGQDAAALRVSQFTAAQGAGVPQPPCAGGTDPRRARDSRCRARRGR